MKTFNPIISNSDILESNFSEQKNAANLISLTDGNLKFKIFPNIFILLFDQISSLTHHH